MFADIELVGNGLGEWAELKLTVFVSPDDCSEL